MIDRSNQQGTPLRTIFLEIGLMFACFWASIKYRPEFWKKIMWEQPVGTILGSIVVSGSLRKYINIIYMLMRDSASLIKLCRSIHTVE